MKNERSSVKEFEFFSNSLAKIKKIKYNIEKTFRRFNPMKTNLKKILCIILAVMTCISVFCVTAFAEDAATPSSGDGNQNLNQWLSIATTILPLVLIAVVFYFLLIRPQKKQEKETQAMRNSISVGDTVTTIGGITGTVLSIKEAEEIMILETGADKNRISVRKWAIQSKDKSAE